MEAATGDDANRQAAAASAAGVAGPVPKKDGRGTSWIPEEALCAAKGWGKTTVDPIHGTRQTRQSFWDKMVENSRGFMKENKLPDLHKGLSRTYKRIEKMFCYDITQAVQKLNDCLVSVHQRRLTGSPTEEDLLMAAVALYNNMSPYAGILQEADAIQCLYARAWEYLRLFPKFSPEAALNAINDMGYSVHGNPDFSDNGAASSTQRKISSPGTD